MTSGQLKRLTSETCEAYLCYLEAEAPNCDNSLLSQKCPEIHNITSEFSDIFSDPSGLPPPRDRDHHIHLQPGSAPTNVKPYRFPQFQKNEIEKIVCEMLN